MLAQWLAGAFDLGFEATVDGLWVLLARWVGFQAPEIGGF